MIKAVSTFLLIFLILSSCNKTGENFPDGSNGEYKQKMRDFVTGLSKYAKAADPTFIVVPQNGVELITNDGEVTSPVNTEYLNAIDAIGQEDLFYGYNNDNDPTPAATTNYVKGFLNLAKTANKKILVTDYCSTPTRMDNSYLQNNNSGYVSLAANQRELNNIPGYPTAINGENNQDVNSMQQVKNFLYLINASNFSTKNSFINAVKATNYDLIIMDLFFNDGTAFSAAEINTLKTKANGGKRLVIAYMSIGEAENYRYYWQPNWRPNNPSWLDAVNPDWAGNYKVKYWNSSWQNIIYGSDNSYLKKILNAGFNGVYLDIIDAFEYYEK